MTKKTVILCTTLMLFSVFPKNSAQAQSRAELRNDVGLELAGKGALYSFSYQRMVTPSVGLQAGLAVWNQNLFNPTVVFIPLGGKFYFAPKNASPFLTGGVVMVTGQFDSGPIDTDIAYGYAGFGFEYRSPAGFLFRGTAYGLFFDGEFVIWPGLHIGYAF